MDTIVFLPGFALAFIISQAYYVTNNYNTCISAASGRNLGKLVSAEGLGGGQKQSSGGDSGNITPITLELS